jgi:hypothetical protein
VETGRKRDCTVLAGDRGMDVELERYVAHANDPRLIPGIYNYCHGRCERCPFTDRCLTFRHLRDDDERDPGRHVLEQTGQTFERTFDLLKHWCEQEGIDFENLREEASSEASLIERVDHEVKSDPLNELAFTYTKAAFDLVGGLERLAPFHEWPPVVREALETIGWYAGVVAAKVDRSLHGFAASGGPGLGGDRVQNDWNGSAKVARLAIAESQRAWDTLLVVGQAPPDARLRQTRELLDRIDSGLTSRFPRAMEFVRPGFDEPEVAAGALSAVARDEPRRRTRGVRAWLHRIAGGWQRRS